MALIAGITEFLHNLALVVVIGAVISALVFAWQNAKCIRARKHFDEQVVKY
jgi:SulP family sulfate permease